MAAEGGCDAVGVDIAPSAIRLAEAKAEERGTSARFVVGDARQLESLGEQFDTVLDCGLFHVFDDDDRPPFVESLGRAVPAGGRYFMLCFSDEEPAGWGPRRVTQAEIRDAFARGWQVDSIDRAEPPRDDPPRARPLVARVDHTDLRPAERRPTVRGPRRGPRHRSGRPRSR